MESKIFNGIVKYEADNTFDNDKFMKLKIYVQHDGKNFNGSSFSLEAIDSAKESLKNVPVLANVVEKEDGSLDFGAHDMSIEENKMGDGYKVIYQEKVVGIIPETNDYEIVEKDGMNYVVVSAYIFKDYSGYTQDLLESSDNYDVSMEILVDDYSYNTKTKVYDINSYRYSGLTILGTDKSPGMKGAHLEVQTFTVDETLAEVSKYAQELKLIFEASKQEDPEEDPIEDPTPEPEDDMGCGDKKKYELTACAKIEKLQGNMEDEWIYDPDGNLVSGSSYYVFDINDTFVFASAWIYDSEWNSERKYVKAKYDSETLAVDMTSIVEVFSQWLTKEEMDMIDAAKVQADFALAEMQTKVETLTNENALLSSTNSELSQFKANVEAEIHKANVDDKLSEFEDEIGSNEEFKLLKETAYSLTIDALEKECFAIVGRSKHKVATPKKAKPVSFVGVNNNTGSGKYGPFDKYFDK